MGLSDGQRIALDQLCRIADAPRSPIRIVGAEEDGKVDGSMRVSVTVDCRQYERLDGGLRYHSREGFALSLPAGFPFEVPSVSTPHTRFLGFPHVQWGRDLCLYVSPETQWIPSTGMFGFMAQLDEWLRRGARDELDDPEGPLHPPVAYRSRRSTSICLSADTPTRDEWPWFGGALLRRRKLGLLEVEGWARVGGTGGDQLFAPTALLDSELPFEFPLKVRDLFQCLEKKGVESARMLAHLMLASERVEEGEPLFVGVGTPSRGVANDIEQRRQHVEFWEIGWADVLTLRTASKACEISRRYAGRETPEELKQLIDSVLGDLFKWQEEASVWWCRVLENRPEIVTRRDQGTAMDWFGGKRVALWGCGALGGLIAEHLARAGVAALRLHDRGVVGPGLLVRQNFTDADVNEAKAVALQKRVQSIAPGVQISSKVENLLGALDRDDWDADIDVVIDATASLSVRAKLEVVLKARERTIPIASVMISGDAQRAVAAVAPAMYGSGPYDVLRRLGLAAMGRDWLAPWTQAFWTSDAGEALRQPEPGCSDPTFVASHADVASLAARSINVLAKALEEVGESATGALLSQALGDRERVLAFTPDIRWGAEGLEFRLARNAWRDMCGWVRTGARQRSDKDETGGLLFGEFDEALGIAWISNVSGPPADSQFSPEQFVCGTEGTGELCDGYEQRMHGVVRYVGTWHSHPESPAVPSDKDYAGIGSIFASAPGEGSHQLMVIVGNATTPHAEIGAYAFEKRDLLVESGTVSLNCRVRGGRKPAPPVECLKKTIGLSLSGGGSRAVAFHLGTLRALEDLKLLDEVSVISGVSGGSVMTGILGYSAKDFCEIDEETVRFLRRGLVKPALWKLLNPRRFVAVLWNFVMVAVPTVVCELIVKLGGLIAGFIPGGHVAKAAIERCRWPLRRRYSRTHVMAEAVADIVGPKMCDADTRQGKSIVFNACELRTGTAFRMSNERYGSWRRGWAPAGELRVADAVMASAAYPPFLPPFDWEKTFEDRGRRKAQRVVVTDGGVYENLGVSVMEPERDGGISEISYDPEILIASDAGAGQMTGETVPTSWSSRMVQVVAAVMRKVQDATKKRLHEHAAGGSIDGFVYVGLGQMDERVHPKPGTWVNREQVIDYPTDFFAMSEKDIRVLAERGETIARALVTRYLLSD